MEITSARTGGAGAAAIDVLTAKIAALNAAIANNAIIASGSLTIVDPAVGGQTIQIAALSAAETAVVMTNMIAVLQARLDALTTALVGL